jgi:hypothetical protein
MTLRREQGIIMAGNFYRPTGVLDGQAQPQVVEPGAPILGIPCKLGPTITGIDATQTGGRTILYRAPALTWVFGVVLRASEADTVSDAPVIGIKRARGSDLKFIDDLLVGAEMTGLTAVADNRAEVLTAAGVLLQSGQVAILNIETGATANVLKLTAETIGYTIKE